MDKPLTPELSCSLKVSLSRHSPVMQAVEMVSPGLRKLSRSIEVAGYIGVVDDPGTLAVRRVCVASPSRLCRAALLMPFGSL